MSLWHAAAGSDTYEYQRTSAIRYLGADSSASVMMGLTQDSVQNNTSSQAASWSQQRSSFNCPQVLIYVLVWFKIHSDIFHLPIVTFLQAVLYFVHCEWFCSPRWRLTLQNGKSNPSNWERVTSAGIFVMTWMCICVIMGSIVDKHLWNLELSFTKSVSQDEQIVGSDRRTEEKRCSSTNTVNYTVLISRQCCCHMSCAFYPSVVTLLFG